MPFTWGTPEESTDRLMQFVRTRLAQNQLGFESINQSGSGTRRHGLRTHGRTTLEIQLWYRTQERNGMVGPPFGGGFLAAGENRIDLELLQDRSNPCKFFYALKSLQGEAARPLKPEEIEGLFFKDSKPL